MKFAVALAAVALALPACKLLRSEDPRQAKFSCQARALEPVVGSVYDAEELLRDLSAGKASLGTVLASLQATPAEVHAMLDALRACEGEPAPAIEPEAQPL